MEPGPPFDLSDPRWLAHRYVEDADAFRFLYLPREDHGAVPFLTDDCLGPRPTGPDVPCADVLSACADGPLHFIFHSAFCGSTLLTRALSHPGAAMGLSEPVVLNDMVGFRLRGAAPAATARAAHAALRLLGRPFEAGEAVIVKPSNLLNGFAELFMALQPQARAVFLHAPLETFLVSVVRKGLACRLWVRELAEGFARQGLLAPLGLEPGDLLRQADLQVAATGWLAQQWLFAELGAKLGASRLASLDADRMTARPAEALGAVSDHLGLAIGATAAESIAAGALFRRHSKSGAAFDVAARSREYAEARKAYGEEIDAVLQWGAKVADNAGIALTAPLPLIA